MLADLTANLRVGAPDHARALHKHALAADKRPLCCAQEWIMMHMALHEPQASGALVSEVLDLLSEH